jgi:hypothetical protein
MEWQAAGTTPCTVRMEWQAAGTTPEFGKRGGRSFNDEAAFGRLFLARVIGELDRG